MSEDMDTQATVSDAERSPEHRCIDELLTFAVVQADAYKRSYERTDFHPTHAKIIDNACRLIGREIISPIFDDANPQRFVGDRSNEPESTAPNMKSQTNPEGI